MKNTVRTFIKENKLLYPDSRVLVAVSGGPDSMALLHVLRELRQEFNLEMHILSVDHQLRGNDSIEDINYVKEVARKWNLPFHGTTLDVRRYAEEEKVSIEVAARELRYEFFTERMNSLQADYLALGHHGDDQVETLVMKLTRTASSIAFSGIPITRPIGQGRIIRPLLCVTKEEIEAYCLKNRISPRIDATNFEEEHTRNYYRHQVIPLLKEKNESIHQTAQHLSKTLTEDEDYLQKEAKKVLEDAVFFNQKKKAVRLDINLFKNHALPLQRRAFHLILNYLYETLPDQLSYIHEEQFLALIEADSGNRSLDFPHNLTLNRAYSHLSIYFKQDFPQEKSFQKVLNVPGTTYLPDGSSLTVTYATKKGKESLTSFYLAIDEFTYPLYVRTRQDGDRMSWKGLNGTKKLKDIFIDAKIPQNQRASWPLVVDDKNNILWLIGLRKGKQSEVNGKQFLYIQFEKGNELGGKGC